MPHASHDVNVNFTNPSYCVVPEGIEPTTSRL